jgi:hypothetical protein
MKNKRLVLLLLVGTMLFSLCAAAYAKTTEIVVWTFLNPADKSGRGKSCRPDRQVKRDLPRRKRIVESMRGYHWRNSRGPSTYRSDVSSALSSYFGEALKSAI